MKKTPLKAVQYAGLTLGGGKGRKTSLCLLEYYPKEDKLFLKELHESIAEKGRTSSDTLIVKKLLRHQDTLKTVALDAPLKEPKCVRCRLVCPGHEKCDEPEIQWMWRRHRRLAPQKKKPHKIFTPYTERCADQWLKDEFGEEPGHALGSNRAPLWARAHYIKRRLKGMSLVETWPRATLMRLGEDLGLRKSHLGDYRHVSHGEKWRAEFLDLWSEAGLTFIYHRDFRLMVRDVYAFEAFLSAYTAHLFDRRLCEPRPKNFPRSEAWVSVPQKEILVDESKGESL